MAPDLYQALEVTSSALFILCLIPQFIRTVKLGHAYDVSALFLVIVLMGSIAFIPVAIHEDLWFFVGSLAANLVVWGTVLWYRLRPRVALAHS